MRDRSSKIMASAVIFGVLSSHAYFVSNIYAIAVNFRVLKALSNGPVSDLTASGWTASRARGMWVINLTKNWTVGLFVSNVVQLTVTGNSPIFLAAVQRRYHRLARATTVSRPNLDKDNTICSFVSDLWYVRNSASSGPGIPNVVLYQRHF
jgi:hypothetical protein